MELLKGIAFESWTGQSIVAGRDDDDVVEVQEDLEGPQDISNSQALHDIRFGEDEKLAIFS